MPHNELVEAAISAAWEIKALEGDIERLWQKVQRDEQARRKAPAARLANDKKILAKGKIKGIWTKRRQEVEPSAWRQNSFAKEMWAEFPEIEDLRTLQRWLREWKLEEERASATSTPSYSWAELEARSKARPEIYQLLNYFPAGFFKRPVG
jgi:hypothetical protein